MSATPTNPSPPTNPPTNRRNANSASAASLSHTAEHYLGNRTFTNTDGPESRSELARSSARHPAPPRPTRVTALRQPPPPGLCSCVCVCAWRATITYNRVRTHTHTLRGCSMAQANCSDTPNWPSHFSNIYLPPHLPPPTRGRTAKTPARPVLYASRSHSHQPMFTFTCRARTFCVLFCPHLHMAYIPD